MTKHVVKPPARTCRHCGQPGQILFRRCRKCGRRYLGNRTFGSVH